MPDTPRPGLPTTRRALAGLPALALAPRARGEPPPERVRAIAFDAFPIFDPRPVLARAAALTPDRPGALRQVWFQQVFAYAWLRTAAQQYVPFERVAAEALDYAVRALDVEIRPHERSDLLAGLFELPVWPDVPASLARWRAQGLRLALVSNLSDAMLSANLRRNGLEQAFDAVLSTDQVRAFKPAPQAYRLASDRLGLARQQIAFAAFASWDAIGASWFGHPTAWINRLGQTAEGIDIGAIPTGADLATLDRLIGPALPR